MDVMGLQTQQLFVKQGMNLYLYDLSYRGKTSFINRGLGLNGGPIIIMNDGDTFLSTQEPNPNSDIMNSVENAQCHLIIGSISDDKKWMPPAIAFEKKITKIMLDKHESQAFLIFEKDSEIGRVKVQEWLLSGGKWNDNISVQLDVSFEAPSKMDL